MSINLSGRIQPHRIPLDGQEPVPWRQGKVGFVDSIGGFKIPPSFDDALPFSNGMAAVQVGAKWGFINAQGDMVIAPRFDDAYYFFEGVAIADLAGHPVLIDHKGTVVASGFYGLFAIAEGRFRSAKGGAPGLSISTEK